MKTMCLKRSRDQYVVASICLVTDSMFERMRGLLGQSSLPEGHALLIDQSNSVHSFFMQFTIDVVYMSRQGKVLEIRRSMKPWRIHIPVWGARSVLELAEGGAHALEVGDVLCLS